MCKEERTKTEELLAEYQAAIAGFHHYDSFRWQSGSLLIAGSLVLYGLVFDTEISQKNFALVSIFITTLLACWMLFAQHYRQLYMSKAYRFYQIEKDLGLFLNTNLGFLGKNKVVSIYGPKGHNIDIFVFVLVSIFGPAFSWARSGFCLWLLSPLPIIIGTTIWVVLLERKMKSQYEKLKMP